MKIEAASLQAESTSKYLKFLNITNDNKYHTEYFQQRISLYINHAYIKLDKPMICMHVMQ